MKRLVATAIALSTLGALPVAAETTLESIPDVENLGVWLILNIGWRAVPGGLVALPMKSMDQCEEQAAIWMSSKRLTDDNAYVYRGFECLEGK